MINKTSDIKSYKDLQAAKINLRISIQEQEQYFKNNQSAKSILFENLPGIKFETGEQLISSFLLGNKVTRNYFAGYLVAKEMIPYIFEKIKGIVSSKE